MSNQGRRNAVQVKPEVIDDWRWQLQTRAWSYEDWAGVSGVALNTISNVMAGKPTLARTVATLSQALKDHPEIPGLADMLRREEVPA